MSNEELRNQFEVCKQANDPAAWDHLALEFFKAGFTLNAAECFRRADDLRGCSFSEAMPARLAVREEVG
jgi:hypothetical protein